MLNTELMTVENIMDTQVSVIDDMKMEVAQNGVVDAYTNTLSENTKRAYMSTIKEFFGVHDLDEITAYDIQGVTPEIANLWTRKQFESGMSPSTINRKLSALHNFYKFLCRKSIGVCSYNPFSTDEGCIRFKNAQRDYTNKRILEPYEINKMFIEARKDTSIVGVRDLLVLELLATTGMRRAEVCNIKLGDIQKTSGKHVVDIVGKGDKHRLIVLTDDIYALIKSYLKLREVTLLDKDLPLIVSHSTNGDPTKHVNEQTIYRIVKKYAELAGIDPETLSPHCFRASFSTLAYNELGMSIEDIRDLMGHSASSTTAIYIKKANLIKNSPSEKLSKMFG